jgi:rod shape-determining protein MreC
MPDFWRRLGAPITFGALALLTAITMVSDRRAIRDDAADLPWWQAVVLEIAIPVQKMLLAPIEAASGAWARYGQLVGVREVNDALYQRIAELEEANLQYREALVASGNLQRIASMRDDFEVAMLPSEIVGLDVSPWFRSVLVDRGRKHGVRSGSPVITDQGVVGLVTATSERAAKTMLLLDRQSAIDGIVQRSRARGIVRGRGTGELAFEFVVRGSDVREGDVVITSGMGGVYPKGLRIGVVRSISDPAGRLLQTAVLAAAVDFGRLEQVFVMLHRGPTMELLYGASGDTGHDPERELPPVSEPPAGVGRESKPATGPTETAAASAESPAS